MKNGRHVDEYGAVRYYKDGKLHREYGPAYEHPNGGKMWLINDELHREDGPAVDWDGYKEWFLNGERHREDGPAVEYPDGGKAWYLNGKELTEQQFNERTKTPAIKTDGMKAKIDHITDYGYKKELYLAPTESETFITGCITVGEDHPWFKSEVGHLIIIELEND